MYCDKDDIALLKQSGVTPVINGASNLKLASGIAPVYSMLSQGLCPRSEQTERRAITPLPCSARCIFFLSAKGSTQRRCRGERGAGARGGNGTRVCGAWFSGRRFAEGYFADMALLDLSAPNMRPLSDIRKSLVYSADTSDVLMTVAGGKIVYDRGNFYIGETLDKIYAECEARRDRLISAL